MKGGRLAVIGPVGEREVLAWREIDGAFEMLLSSTPEEGPLYLRPEPGHAAKLKQACLEAGVLREQ